ncbi:hypothetical protein [Streptomyces griseorubiginosus]|uniref:hypothetical protein n=1 Tax=Streptomyces griseorubiginosus TaxID=67304 RepID=UPI00365577D4
MVETEDDVPGLVTSPSPPDADGAQEPQHAGDADRGEVRGNASTGFADGHRSRQNVDAALSVAVVFPVLRTAFPLFRHGVGGLGEW